MQIAHYTLFSVLDVNSVPKYYQDSEQISDSVNLLISILVRYPEVGTIRFDPERNTLKLTFMIAGKTAQPDLANIKQLILTSLTAYHILEDLTVTVCEVVPRIFEGVAMLTVLRDVDTLTKAEFDLIITLLRDRFADRLITDQNTAILEEDLLVQEELIENMLENVKKQHSANSLIGIREDGRVLVFNK